MPVLGAYIPDRALPPEAARTLLGTCTDLLLRHEGVALADQTARALARGCAGLRNS